MRNILNVIGFPLYLINRTIHNKRRQAPIGDLIEVGGKKIHTIVTGDKDARCTVILDAGLSCCSLDWVHIQPELSKFTRVVSFDRPGYGWSTLANGKYTSEDMVSDLHQLLTELYIEGPLILVGHSYGGLNMRLFASKFPEKVAGIVLIDSVHENRYISNYWDQSRKKEYKKSNRLFQLGFIMSEIGIPRLLGLAVGRKWLPAPYQDVAHYTSYQPSAYEAVCKEFIYAEKSAQLVKQASPLEQNLPVTVLSSKNNDPTWKQQQELLGNLTNNVSTIQTNHGHSMHLENPKLVIEVIKDLVLIIKGELNETNN
ncbi:alpha/beta hydrolase [Ornithinibacillus caprae]|nr:alpha/beta hydrolase [Ornithinibacillus caprae]